MLLHVESERAVVDDLSWRDWRESSFNLERLEEELRESRPRSFAFSRAEAQNSKSDPANEGNTTVGVAFTVQGSYEQARQLINLLELSNQFVIIDGVSLGGATGRRPVILCDQSRPRAIIGPSRTR